jgi:hypothetical protein
MVRPRAAHLLAPQSALWSRSLGPRPCSVGGAVESGVEIAGRLRREGQLSIRHETIYRYIWVDRKEGGTLYTYLRRARKQCRTRYGSYDSRGRLAGKRMIGERPAIVEGLPLRPDADRLPAARATTPTYRRRGHTPRGQIDPPGVVSRAHGHRRQRDGVFMITLGSNGAPRPLLFRNTASQLGAWDQREHERSAASVSPEGTEHGTPDTSRVR